MGCRHKRGERGIKGSEEKRRNKKKKGGRKAGRHVVGCDRLDISFMRAPRMSCLTSFLYFIPSFL